MWRIDYKETKVEMGFFNGGYPLEDYYIGLGERQWWFGPDYGSQWRQNEVGHNSEGSIN